MQCRKPATDTALPRLRDALKAIAEAATNGLEVTTPEDAIAAVLDAEAIARTASQEFYGLDGDDDPAWDVVIGVPDTEGEYDVRASPDEVPL